MTILYADVETWNEVPINVGTARYCESVEIMVIAWAVDDGPVHVLDLTTMPGSLPGKAFILDWMNASLVVAHNAFFDRSVLATKGITRPLSQWHCTQAQALAHSLPGSLDKLSAIYNLGDAAKDKEGKQLIQLFCKPRPKTSKIRRATRETHPAEWQKFLDYAGQDIVALRALYAKLPKWNWTEAEREAWMLNQEINDRGFLIDQELAVQAIATCERAKAALQSRTEVITGTDLSVQQRAALQALLKEYGVTLPDMTASTLERRLEDPDLPAPVRDLIGIRLEMCQTSNAKWPKLLASVSSDGRLRGTSQFCGASRTGRDSGRIFQPYNLPRPPKYLDGDEDFVEAIKLALVDLIYDNPMEVTSAALRGALVAPPGKKLVVADLNAIEGRVAAWVAGEQWKLDAYARGDDLYVLAYAASFHKRPEDVTKAERQIGKVEELALGFGGAAGAFGTMAAMYGVELPDDEVRAVVKAWRAANPKIVAFWWALEDAVKAVTTTTDGQRELGPLTIKKQGAWLRIILPSGRSLSYAQPKIEYETKVSGTSAQGAFKETRTTFTYMGLNQYTRKWERISSYGGKLFENCLGANTEALTLYGWKRIIYLRNDDLVWDGLEWVAHAGVVTQGPRETVKINGVGVTPDHLVWVNNQWEHAGEVDQEKAASSFDRHFGEAQRGASRFALQGERWAKKLLGNRVRLRQALRHGCQRVQQRAAKILRLSKDRPITTGEQHARYVEIEALRSLERDAEALRKPEPRSLRALRWAWLNGVRPLAEGFLRILGRYGRDVPTGADVGTLEQLEGVFTGQLRVGDEKRTSSQHESEQNNRHTARADAVNRSGGTERPEQKHTVVPPGEQLASGKAIRRAGFLEQTYDIVNCGPRHRFVVRGGEGYPPFLVHNCVQAIARDVLVEAMKRCAANGFGIVLTVYDEIIAEAALERTVDELIDVLTTVPHWAPGLPLAAGGFETQRYYKG